MALARFVGALRLRYLDGTVRFRSSRRAHGGDRGGEDELSVAPAVNRDLRIVIDDSGESRSCWLSAS